MGLLKIAIIGTYVLLVKDIMKTILPRFMLLQSTAKVVIFTTLSLKMLSQSAGDDSWNFIIANNLKTKQMFAEITLVGVFRHLFY